MSKRYKEYDRIQPLAEQIYAEATTLNKPDRHTISDAARLISWLCYQAEYPDDPEAKAAIETLRKALSPITAEKIIFDDSDPRQSGTS